MISYTWDNNYETITAYNNYEIPDIQKLFKRFCIEFVEDDGEFSFNSSEDFEKSITLLDNDEDENDALKEM